MNYQESLDFILGTPNPGGVYERNVMQSLLEKLGNPHMGVKYVHIAGTNGKGTTSAFVASVLREAGYKTGLYTSPFIQRFNERIQVNGEQIPDEDLARITTQIADAVPAVMAEGRRRPTIFELITALGFCWFKEQQCDIVVLEVGLGGRLDATNVIDAPEAAVIMNIGLDHTEILGDTLEKIAAEKAGIFKPGCEAAVYDQGEGVIRVLQEKARETGTSLRLADFSKLQPEFDSLEGQSFLYRGEPYALALLGDHQLRNAAVVLETVEILRRRGWELSHEAVEHGLYATVWPARFELVSEEPPFIVDGGHNPQCAQTVRDNLLRYFPEQRRVLLVGVLADKDYPALFEILNEAADAWVCVTPDSPRALPAEKLAEHLGRFGKPVTVCETIPLGVDTAREQAGETGMACSVGSLYMAGAVRACFGLM